MIDKNVKTRFSMLVSISAVKFIHESTAITGSNSAIKQKKKNRTDKLSFVQCATNSVYSFVARIELIEQ